MMTPHLANGSEYWCDADHTEVTAEADIFSSTVAVFMGDNHARNAQLFIHAERLREVLQRMVDAYEQDPAGVRWGDAYLVLKEMQ